MCPSLTMHLRVLLLFLSSLLLVLAQPTTLGTNTTANLAAVTNSSFFAAKSGCNRTCGNVVVPYPFGIGDVCSMNFWFIINCNASYNPAKPFLGTVEVISISQTQVRLRNIVASLCQNQSAGSVTIDIITWFRLNGPYTFSDTANKFIVVGCNNYGLMSGSNFTSGCLSYCSDHSAVIDNCTGIGCCESDFPKGLQFFNVSLGTLFSDEQVSSYDPCSYAFMGETDQFQFQGLSDLSSTSNFINRTMENVPVVLDFMVGTQSCAEVQNSNASLCQQNANCTDIDTITGHIGYLCGCNTGYEGNPYLGCTDIDECNTTLNLNDCDVNAICTNTPGKYNCSCKDPYVGDGFIGGCQSLTNATQNANLSRISGTELSLGLSFGFLLLLIGATLLYSGINRRKLIKLREQLFLRNGGLLMKQKISSIDGRSLESSKIFTAEELKKATDNYAENRILGRGGYGVVYKGILPDQSVVAIKKSKVIDGNQVEQFINELLIVTQVNHRNVVKLLGCCFESEVPELVYEFVSNGTLFQHIQQTLSWLTLDHRLRIAAEAASALSYLHSHASIPIIHRDVKSANILLDENYVAKMADFGGSRLVPVDQTQVTTLVQGTLGYLDPEYFHSSQLTEKSDVYSFGVVMAELMTGKKPISFERFEKERNLATYFIMTMKENRLFQILEPRVVREGTLEQLQAIAELVKRCLSLKSEERPAMKEVFMELEGLRKYKKDTRVNQQSHEEGKSLLSDEAPTDMYAFSISPCTSDGGISEQYSFNSMTIPLTKSFH